MSFSELTDDQIERLALLVEELGEAAQAAGKVLRHGYASINPVHPGPDNREALEKELGDVRFAMRLLCVALDLSEINIDEAAEEKAAKVWEFLHHQDEILKTALKDTP